MKTEIAVVLFAVLFAFAVQADTLPGGHGAQRNHVPECGYELVGIYNSGDKGERFKQVVFGPARYTVYHLVFPAEPGDNIIVLGDSEATTERDTNTEFTTVFNMFSPSSGLTPMSKENGVNIDIDRHHEKVHSSGQAIVPQTHTPGQDVQVMWQWGAQNGSIQPQYIWVGCGEQCWQNYGALIAQHYRPKQC